MIKKIVLVFLSCFMFCLCACKDGGSVINTSAPVSVCDHNWTEPTCTESGVCQKCGQLYQEPLGHDLKSADCLNPARCSRCSYTEGSPLGHEYESLRCTKCGETHERYTEVYDALVDVKRYINYNKHQYEILELAIERYEKFGGFDYYNDVLESNTKIINNYLSILNRIIDIPELTSLYSACRSLPDKDDYSKYSVMTFALYMGKDNLDVISKVNAVYKALCNEYDVSLSN